MPASEELQTELFLNPGEFVYEIKRLRSFDDKPFMIELGYIPIRVAPELNAQRVEGSISTILRTQLEIRLPSRS